MYLLNNLIALDQLVNTILGGHPDETLSSRAYRAEQNNKIFGKFFRPVIDGIFFWQKQHCYRGYLAEKQRKQLPSNF